ncbi:MAG TPA: 2-oxoacid:acceptor oxidoreductase subunit alpha, partial [Spirochaetes bacterium]|nr:2-oxoacid:acceptor oxidoreductase subunit alpha [Spirochaetota bacterium]
LAPANVEENLYLTIDAFNLAEKYQTPVFLLSDASLALRVEAIKRPDMSKVKHEHRMTRNGKADEKFLRYMSTESGISPTGIPGMPGHAYAATGLEHAENSGPRTNPDTRNLMTEKRWRKFDNIEDEWKPVEREGDEQAEVGVISWGLTQSIAKEAVQRLRAKGLKVAALYPKMLWPLPVKAIKAFVDSVNQVLIPEANFQGQFAEIIKAEVPIHDKLVKLNVYRGEPFIPREIEEKIEEIYPK